MATTWTPEDQDKALAQGWGIFAIDGDPHRLTIQRNDEAGIFDSDKAAQAFVVGRLQENDPLVCKAFDVLYERLHKGPTKEQLREELERDLRQFSGTEEWHQWSSLYPKYIITDGVKYLADKAGAYWLLDVIGSWNSTTPKVSREEFQVWRLTVRENGSATVVADDGNGVVIARQEIEMTDFILPEIKLYAERNGRHLVICLPQER